MITFFSILYIVLGLFSGSQASPVSKANPPSLSADRSQLAPLTQTERTLDLQRMVANQPDFVADEVFFYGEQVGGYSAKRRIARKGSRTLINTGQAKLITEPGKFIRLDEKNKTFEEIPRRTGLELGSGQPINPSELAYQKGVAFLALGTLMVDGHKCLKIEAKLAGQASQVFLYAAADLRYLVIATELLDPPRRAVQRLQNVSLEVPDGLLEITSDYKPLPKHKWTRVDSASVRYDGKPPKDFSVFRSEDGDQLFITVYEPHPNSGLPYPWHYLLYLKEQTVEIGFQGMLITANGEFAWETKEKEAISSGDHKPVKAAYPCEGRKCPKTTVGANFAQFPSVYYEDRKSIVRVAW